MYLYAFYNTFMIKRDKKVQYHRINNALLCLVDRVTEVDPGRIMSGISVCILGQKSSCFACTLYLEAYTDWPFVEIVQMNTVVFVF